MDYILVSQTSATIEHFSRQSDGSWRYRVHTGLEASLTIASIKCRVKLSEVYERVNFETEPAAAISKKSKKKMASKAISKKGKKR